MVAACAPSAGADTQQRASEPKAASSEGTCSLRCPATPHRCQIQGRLESLLSGTIASGARSRLRPGLSSRAPRLPARSARHSPGEHRAAPATAAGPARRGDRAQLDTLTAPPSGATPDPPGKGSAGQLGEYRTSTIPAPAPEQPTPFPGPRGVLRGKLQNGQAGASVALTPAGCGSGGGTLGAAVQPAGSRDNS